MGLGGTVTVPLASCTLVPASGVEALSRPRPCRPTRRRSGLDDGDRRSSDCRCSGRRRGTRRRRGPGTAIAAAASAGASLSTLCKAPYPDWPRWLGQATPFSLLRRPYSRADGGTCWARPRAAWGPIFSLNKRRQRAQQGAVFDPPPSEARGAGHGPALRLCQPRRQPATSGVVSTGPPAPLCLRARRSLAKHACRAVCPSAVSGQHAGAFGFCARAPS